MKRTVVITGANRGIGLVLVKEFARNNYDIWACVRKQTKEFEERLQIISQENKVRIKPVYFDLSEEFQVKSGIQQIVKDKKFIDVLVNNAGVSQGSLLTMTSLKTMREVYDINVFAQVQIMQLIARQMMRQKSGCIINMCSVGGIETNPGYLAYGSSKAALIWITKCASKELGTFGIRVNGVAPGLTNTDMGHYAPDEEIDKKIQRTALQRMAAPEEIAHAVLFLASDKASFITGEIMRVDGGRD